MQRDVPCFSHVSAPGKFLEVYTFSSYPLTPGSVSGIKHTAQATQTQTTQTIGATGASNKETCEAPNRYQNAFRQKMGPEQLQTYQNA